MGFTLRYWLWLLCLHIYKYHATYLYITTPPISLAQYITINVSTYFPLLTDGIAIDLRFFSSASFRIFLIAVSRSCWALVVPHDGLLTWMTNLAEKFLPGQIAAANKHIMRYYSTVHNKIELISGSVAVPLRKTKSHSHYTF